MNTPSPAFDGHPNGLLACVHMPHITDEPPRIPEPGAADDRQLVYEVAAGDRKALSQLYDRHAATLLGVALAILRGPRAEAEDLLHDVFVEIWQHAGEYDPARASVRTWMTLRMRSRALDRLKSAGRARASSLDESPHLANEIDADRAAAQAPDLAPDHAVVRRALAGLPPEQRDVIRLQYYEGLSSAEAAERLGVPVGTVKSRTAAAMRKLGGALRPEADAERTWQ